MKKSIFKSKTIWLNLIMGLLAILAIVDPSILDIFGLSMEVKQHALAMVGAITAVLNVFLRMITGQAVTIKK